MILTIHLRPYHQAETSHFALDTLYIRPVQAELVRLLLLPSSDPRFTSCVLVHGMGGTGKVSSLAVYSLECFSLKRFAAVCI